MNSKTLKRANELTAEIALLEKDLRSFTCKTQTYGPMLHIPNLSSSSLGCCSRRPLSTASTSHALILAAIENEVIPELRHLIAVKKQELEAL